MRTHPPHPTSHNRERQDRALRLLAMASGSHRHEQGGPFAPASSSSSSSSFLHRSTASSAAASFSTTTHTKPPTRTSTSSSTSANIEVVQLIEQLCAHMLPASYSAQGSAESDAILRSSLHLLGTSRRPPEAALDEFFTMQQAQRKIRRQYEGTGQEERGRALATRLEELNRKLSSPLLKGRLQHRWAALHLLTTLARTTRGGSGGVMDAFVSTDLPALHPPPSASTTAGTSYHHPQHHPHSGADHGSSVLNSSMGSASATPPAGRSQHALAMAQQSSLMVDMEDGEQAELALLRDCLYCFQGIDGRSIKYDAASGTHVLDPALRGTHGPAKLDVLLHMAELGWLFRKVQTFADRAKAQQREVGLVGQALGYVLQDELTEYYRLIAVLETQLNEQQQQQQQQLQPAASASSSLLYPPGHSSLLSASHHTFGAASSSSSSPARSGGLTLRRLAVWVEDPLQRMRLVATLCDSLEHVRGGALASVLFAHTQQGDPLARGLVQRVLGRVCVPLFEMIRRWVSEGELVDAHGEFFVAALAVEKGGDSGGDHDEKLWHHKYALRKAMIPLFLPEPLAQKILVLGKSINFMRRCCKDREWASLGASTAALQARRAAEEMEFSYANVEVLHRVVDGIAAVVNARLIELLLGPRYQLMTHLRALKKFLALGQGDFVTCLMDSIGPELSKGAHQVYRHDLTGKLEAALRSSNAQFEQPDILNRVGVRLLEASGGEEGWEVFSLDYQVEAPISAIIHSKALDTYGRIFHLLWRIKRVEWSLAASWKQHMAIGHPPTTRNTSSSGSSSSSKCAPPHLAGVLQRCNLARREMIHFVSNLSSFVWFEVLEASWKLLEEELATAKDMDGLVKAHDAYLRRIIETSFLSQDKAPLHAALQAVFSTILSFCALQSDLCLDAMREQRNSGGRSKGSGAEEQAQRVASQVLVLRYEQRVQATTAEYETACGALLDLLQAQEGQSDAVRFLIFRLDFNEFYTTQKTNKLAQGKEVEVEGLSSRLQRV